MRKAIDRSFLARLLRSTALTLGLMMAGAGVHAQAIGTDGAAAPIATRAKTQHA